VLEHPPLHRTTGDGRRERHPGETEWKCVREPPDDRPSTVRLSGGQAVGPPLGRSPLDEVRCTDVGHARGPLQRWPSLDFPSGQKATYPASGRRSVQKNAESAPSCEGGRRRSPTALAPEGFPRGLGTQTQHAPFFDLIRALSRALASSPGASHGRRRRRRTLSITDAPRLRAVPAAKTGGTKEPRWARDG